MNSIVIIRKHPGGGGVGFKRSVKHYHAVQYSSLLSCGTYHKRLFPSMYGDLFLDGSHSSACMIANPLGFLS